MIVARKENGPVKLSEPSTDNRPGAIYRARVESCGPERTVLSFPIRVAELFAGVGGFRLGLEGRHGKGRSRFKVIWSNQWEPATKVQHASTIYVKRFGPDGHSNMDIGKVKVHEEVPEFDMLVGGFPCQDYSVARTLNQAAGLAGRKGVLWWQIHRVLKDKGAAVGGKKGRMPPLILLENVDRLLKSPASQRGRDFAVMLASLSELGYFVEWRVINAADYGFPQRRRRVFILGYHRSLGDLGYLKDPKSWVLRDGVLAKAFPCSCPEVVDVPSLLEGGLADLTEEFNKGGKDGMPFQNAGFMLNREYWTFKVSPEYKGKRMTLGRILQREKEIQDKDQYVIPSKDLPRWIYLKGAKKEARVDKKTGHEYKYEEGPIAFPDHLNQPSRTMVTGEGGRTPSRFKHVVKVNGYYRRLTPVEMERLNMFPDGHTEGAPDGRRAFFMGNALVVGVVDRIGKSLSRHLKAHSSTV